MTEFNVELCETCPSRGLCVGEVALDAVRVKYDESQGSYPGYKLVAIDEDGVTNRVTSVVPESYTINTRKGDRQLATNAPRGGIRSDVIIGVLQDDPGEFLDAISERASNCPCPDGLQYTSGYAITYERTCRATAKAVLEALATKVADAPEA